MVYHGSDKELNIGKFLKPKKWKLFATSDINVALSYALRDYNAVFHVKENGSETYIFKDMDTTSGYVYEVSNRFFFKSPDVAGINNIWGNAVKTILPKKIKNRTSVNAQMLKDAQNIVGVRVIKRGADFEDAKKKLVSMIGAPEGKIEKEAWFQKQLEEATERL